MERNISFTVKTKDGSLVTVRADEPEEFVARVTNAMADDEFVDAVALLEQVIRGGANATLASATATVVSSLGGEVISTPENPNFAPVAPPVTNEAATPVQAGQRTCAHGVMTKRTGTGQYGEWRGYFCPTPKGTADQCKPVYLKKTDKTEWANF
jgi:hypothetical protein